MDETKTLSGENVSKQQHAETDKKRFTQRRGRSRWPCLQQEQLPYQSYKAKSFQPNQEEQNPWNNNDNISSDNSTEKVQEAACPCGHVVLSIKSYSDTRPV